MITPVLALLSHEHLPILLLIGFAIVFGTIGAKLFQRLRIPQVVGYIVIGAIVGRSGFNFLDTDAIRSLLPFNFFALGVIGFMIGGELYFDVFRKYGRSFFTILLAEGMGAFVCVGGIVFGLAWALTGDFNKSLALGLVLGAISSATAPAATVDVLWEYKTRGILTTTVFAIVALDDALALLLYGIASSVAGLLLGGAASSGIAVAVGRTAYELLGAVALGAAAGFLLNVVLRTIRDRDKALPFIVGSLALVIGAARLLEVDLILSTMSLGVALRNLAPRRTKSAFETVEGVAQPIYVLFFVVVGARLHVLGMAGWMWALAAAYVVGRTVGKVLGANLGARWAGAATSVRKYLGMCLFSQAGVAVGLAILASDRFPNDMGAAIIMIVTATTFLVQIIGPPCVKAAVKRAGEVGLNVTEQDLLDTHQAGDMMTGEPPTFRVDTPLSAILRTLAETTAMTYPVVDDGGKLAGLISIQELRRSFLATDLASFLVAFDLMQTPPDTITPDLGLAEGVARMREQDLECLPVVAGADDNTLVGLLELRSVNRALSQEILRRRQLADAD